MRGKLIILCSLILFIPHSAIVSASTSFEENQQPPNGIISFTDLENGTRVYYQDEKIVGYTDITNSEQDRIFKDKFFQENNDRIISDNSFLKGFKERLITEGKSNQEVFGILLNYTTEQNDNSGFTIMRLD